MKRAAELLVLGIVSIATFANAAGPAPTRKERDGLPNAKCGIKIAKQAFPFSL